MNNGRILIGQYYGKSFFSRLIRWKTWSDITHTSAFLPDMTNVIEAWGGGVTKRYWRDGHTKGTRIDLFEVRCTEEQAQAFYQYLWENIGKKYDLAGIFGFAFSAKTENSEKVFCSELIFSAAKHAGIVLLDRIEPYKVYPGLIQISPIMRQVSQLET